MITDDDRPARSTLHSLAALVGVVGYLGIGLFYLGAGLLVPYPGVFVLWAIWIIGLVATIRVARQRPAWTPLAPPVAFAFWVAFVQIGSWLFGWTA